MSTTAMRTIGHRIGAGETSGSSMRTARVFNPATGEQQAEVVLADAHDVDRAVQAARAAFETWSGVSVTRRARVMFNFRDLMAKHTTDLARVM
jgi:malonate-semialdehyde dehydrogenase (acetylating) / methylmalonate-semialdehyde dehydrogenase